MNKPDNKTRKTWHKDKNRFTIAASILTVYMSAPFAYKWPELVIERSVQDVLNYMDKCPKPQDN